MATSTLSNDDALTMAGRIIYELSGRRVIWPLLRVTESFDLAKKRRYQIIRVAGRPIVDVHAVTLGIDGEYEPVTFKKISSSKIKLDEPINGGFDAVCGSHKTLDVEYTYGAKPPLEVLQAIEDLAEELISASENDGQCVLPDNVQSVSRQGFNLSMETAEAIQSTGTTGVDSVDKVLAYYNSVKAKRVARVISPTVPVANRTYS